jgi:hypothetical protein
LKCIQCCLQCVECIVKFINTQAYIQIALRGRNFCYAAKDGFELVWSNPLRYAIVGGIGTVIMFLGKLIIACLTAFLFYLFITYVNTVKTNYSEPLWQVAVHISLFSWSSSLLTSLVCSSCRYTRCRWMRCCSASLSMRLTRRARARLSGPLPIWRTSWIRKIEVIGFIHTFWHITHRDMGMGWIEFDSIMGYFMSCMSSMA